MRNLKKVIALVAVFAMLVTSVAFAQTYSDVKADDNYAEAIEMLSNLNILTGDDEDGDGVMDFRPNDTITRAEVAAVVCRIQNMNNLSQTGTQFDDVTSANWASGYIAQAAGQGIINGNGDGTFDPEGNVKYEQAVKMFVRTLGYEPYVNANGGYPSGDLAAANRYGILDGVVGGGTGVDATRGQIAQMAFNALETPMMDRYSYGTEENYQIYDGKGEREFMTLLTRDFSVKKFSGVVKENQVTSLKGGNPIDVDDAAEVDFDYNVNDDYSNYEVNSISKVYAGESDVAEYLGYEVNAYVKETNRSGEYEILAVAPTSTNKVTSFTLDQFSSANGSKIEYYKNENDNTTTTLTVDSDILDSSKSSKGVIFNGVAYNGDETTIAGILNDLEVKDETNYSGKVTLIDNDSKNGYDVIDIEVASSAVVDEVKSNGKVVFKETPKNCQNQKIELNFDEDEKDVLIKLTKNGEAIEYTDLQEWDVLSILFNNEGTKYYDAKVIDGTKVDGTVGSRKSSKTSADGFKYTIGGNEYDVAAFCYGGKAVNVGWSVGTAGMFYVDEYGKIVAYDKNGSTSVSATAGNYGYVLNAAVTSGSFDEETVRVQLLDKSGKVYTADLATKVKIEYSSDADINGNSVTVKDHSDDIADAMMNQLITFESNTSGEVKTITFPTNANVDDESGFVLSGQGTAAYDEEDMTIKNIGSFDVNEDTLVFFIKGESALTGLGDTNAASKTTSKVGTAASLADGEYEMVVYDEEDGVAGVIVVFNTTGGISPSSNIAVVDSVGEANDDEGNKVYEVTYFMNGEKLVSKTDADIDIDGLDEDTVRGSIFKFSVSADGSVINDGELYAVLSRDMDDANAGVVASSMKTFGVGSKEAMYLGPVYDYTSGSKRIRIANMDITDWDFSSTTSIKCTNANVYVIDEDMKNNKVYVGDASDVDFDKDLTQRAVAETKNPIKVDGVSGAIDSDELGLGLMDYVFAVEYDGDILDVVIYKAHGFKYSIED